MIPKGENRLSGKRSCANGQRERRRDGHAKTTGAAARPGFSRCPGRWRGAVFAGRQTQRTAERRRQALRTFVVLRLASGVPRDVFAGPFGSLAPPGALAFALAPSLEFAHRLPTLHPPRLFSAATSSGPIRTRAVLREGSAEPRTRPSRKNPPEGFAPRTPPAVPNDPGDRPCPSGRRCGDCTGV